MDKLVSGKAMTEILNKNGIDRTSAWLSHQVKNGNIPKHLYEGKPVKYNLNATLEYLKKKILKVEPKREEVKELLMNVTSKDDNIENKKEPENKNDDIDAFLNRASSGEEVSKSDVEHYTNIIKMKKEAELAKKLEFENKKFYSEEEVENILREVFVEFRNSFSNLNNKIKNELAMKIDDKSILKSTEIQVQLCINSCTSKMYKNFEAINN